MTQDKNREMELAKLIIAYFDIELEYKYCKKKRWFR